MSVRDVGRFILISFRSVRLVQFTVQLGKTSVTVVRLPKFRFPPTPTPLPSPEDWVKFKTVPSVPVNQPG